MSGDLALRRSVEIPSLVAISGSYCEPSQNARVLLQPGQLYLCYLFELLLLLYQKYTPIPCFSTEVQTHTFLVFIVWRKRVFNIT